MEVTGRVRLIGHVQDISSSFRKRELVITTEEQYPQHLMVEFTQDKVNLLDTFQVGEPVRVSINLRGREWTNPQGEVKFFNSIQGWKIEKLIPTQPQDAMGQQANASAMGASQFGQNQAAPQGQPGMNQSQGYNQFAQQSSTGNQFPPASGYKEEDHDDLPF